MPFARPFSWKRLVLISMLMANPVMAQEYETALREAAAGLPGAAAAVITPSGTWTGAVGFADLRTRRPMRADTRLYIGSMSKPITALATLRLRERGVIDTDAPITNQLEHWQFGQDREAITWTHLLTHTAGLPREGGRYWFTGRFPGPEDLRSLLRDAELTTPPGERWSYSNMGYAVIGHALSVATNSSFEDVIEREVFEPLGMRRSGARGPAPPDLARGYSPEGRELGREGNVFAGLGRHVGERRERLYHDAAAMAPAFGMYSTAADMAKLLEALLRGPTPEEGVRHDLLTARHRFHDDPTTAWTLGMRVTQDELGTLHRHNGWFAAHRCHLSLRVDEGVAVTVLANGDDADPGRLGAAMMQAALEGR